MIGILRVVSEEGTGRRISNYIASSGLSIEEVAEHCMVARQTVYKWRKGKCVPKVDQLATLAGLFGVTIDDLVVAEKRVIEY